MMYKSELDLISIPIRKEIPAKNYYQKVGKGFDLVWIQKKRLHFSSQLTFKEPFSARENKKSEGSFTKSKTVSNTLNPGTLILDEANSSPWSKAGIKSE